MEIDTTLTEQKIQRILSDFIASPKYNVDGLFVFGWESDKLLWTKAGYMAVYPIVNGSAQEALFEGTREQCKTYTDILLENKPEMKGNIIVLEL